MNRKDDTPLIYLVDDDEAVRDSLGMLFRSVGLEHQAYASALDFLRHYDSARNACLVADIRMPGLSGLELQQRLNDRGEQIPLIFITGHGDVPMAVTAMKAGASDFVQKPFRDQDLIDRINRALALDLERRKRRAEQDEIRARLALLTPREREVMERVARGQANKVIAMDLGVSQRTVELHRARVMKKLKMRSVAELVHALDRIGGVARDGAAAADTGGAVPI
jgi:two-component system response regulator FixJ